MSAVSAVAGVMADLSHVAKRDHNSQQGFAFRGVDAVVNAVGPILRKHQVVVAPLVEDYAYGSVEVGKNRTPMGHARVTVRYRWYAPDGEFIESVSVGEAMDSGDKATAKAMSVAWRTCLLQTLALPTDDPDPDHDTYTRSERSTDMAWLEDFERRLVLAATPGEVRGLWGEVTQVYADGRLTDEDSRRLKQAMTGRANELKGEPVGGDA